MSVCQDQEEKIILYSLCELDPEASKEVESHFALCESCRNEQQELAVILGAIKDIGEVPALSSVEIKSLVTNIKNGYLKKRCLRNWGLRPSRLIPATVMACLVVITVGIIGYMKLNVPSEIPAISKYQNEIIISDRDLEILSNLDLLKEMDTLQKLSHVFNLRNEIKSQEGNDNGTSGMIKNGHRKEYA